MAALMPGADAASCSSKHTHDKSLNCSTSPTHSSVTWPSLLQPTPHQVELGAPLVPHGSVSVLHGTPAAARQRGLSSAAGQLLHDFEASNKMAAATAQASGGRLR